MGVPCSVIHCGTWGGRLASDWAEAVRRNNVPSPAALPARIAPRLRNARRPTRPRKLTGLAGMLTLYVLIRWWHGERRLRQRNNGRAAPKVRASPVTVSQLVGEEVAVGAQARLKTLSSATFRDLRHHPFGSTQQLYA